MGAPEIIRLVLIGGGFLMIGFNIAIIVHARYLVYAVRAWRLFLLGKCLFVAFVCATLWHHIDDTTLTWRVMLAGIAILTTITSLVLLTAEYRRRKAEERHSGVKDARTTADEARTEARERKEH